MEDSRIIYFLVPLGYSIFFAALLIGTVLVSFFRRTRFLSSYLFTGAMTSLLGFGVWVLFYVGYFIKRPDMAAKDGIFGQTPGTLKMLIALSPLPLGLQLCGGTFAFGIYLVFRDRRKLRSVENSKPSSS